MEPDRDLNWYLASAAKAGPPRSMWLALFLVLGLILGIGVAILFTPRLPTKITIETKQAPTTWRDRSDQVFGPAASRDESD